MILNRLKKSPLECVRLTAKQTVRVWLGKHHMETPHSKNEEKSIIFSPIEIEPGDHIEVDGLGNVCFQLDGHWFAVRIFDVGVNIERHAIGLDEDRRAIARRILPFQYGIGQGIFSAGMVFEGQVKPQHYTRKISNYMRDEMLAKADILQTVDTPLEWQDMRSKNSSAQICFTDRLHKKTA